VLPVPPIRSQRGSHTRSLLTRINDYTLWAFNPQPPLAYPRRRPVRSSAR